MNQRIRTKLVLRKKVKIVASKILLSIILFLVGMIVSKSSFHNKMFIQTNIYEKSFPFQAIKKKCKEYFGNIFSEDVVTPKTETVFHESITYDTLDIYQNGVLLNVSNHYMVPCLANGIILYIGEKEGIGKTIIIEQEDGVDVYYGNLESTDKKLYDYVEEGEIIGQIEANSLYLAFQKKGEFLDYKNYL